MSNPEFSEPHQPSFEDEVTTNIEVSRIEKTAQEVLDQKHRTLIYLHFFEGCSYKKIGDMFGIQWWKARTEVNKAVRALTKAVLYPPLETPVKSNIINIFERKQA